MAKSSSATRLTNLMSNHTAIITFEISHISSYLLGATDHVSEGANATTRDNCTINRNNSGQFYCDGSVASSPLMIKCHSDRPSIRGSRGRHFGRVCLWNAAAR